MTENALKCKLNGDNRIYLYDDRLVITFNHKDGTETITVEDKETALAEAGFGSDLVSFAIGSDTVYTSVLHDQKFDLLG